MKTNVRHLFPFSGGPEGRVPAAKRACFPSKARPSGPPLNRMRAAFSFAEVMFAVVILGIGFIMVAAIFPVAIQQTQANGEESSAAATAREAANMIASLPGTITNPIYYPPGSTIPATVTSTGNLAYTIPTIQLFPPTVKNYVPGNINAPVSATTVQSVPPPAVVAPFVGFRWQAINAQMISVSDPRYAYIPFYRRENGSSSAQLIVVAVTARQKPIYGSSDVTLVIYNDGINTSPGTYPAPPTSPPGPTVICPDLITVNSGGADGLTVNLDMSKTVNYKPQGKPGGRTYRLGFPLSSTLFAAEPGDGMALTAGSNGLWGTSGATGDLPLTGEPALLQVPPTLQASVAYAQLQATPTSIGGQIQLYANAADTTVPAMAGTGAFIIIADDYPFDPGAGGNTPNGGPTYNVPPNISSTATGSTLFSVGALNGRIFRLGAAITTQQGLYALDPQYGMRPASTSGYSPDTVPNPALAGNSGQSPYFPSTYGTNPTGGANILTGIGVRAKVFIIGLAKDPTTGNYGNRAQDVGVFSTYFQIK